MPTLIDNSTQKALSTVARVKIFLDISGDAKDGLLTMLINQATGFIENYVGPLLSQTYTERLDGGGKSLVLSGIPVTTFTSLRRNDSGDASTNWQTLDTDEYFVDLTSGLVTMANGCDFLPGAQRFEAAYVGGYKIDFANENDRTKHTLPMDIEQACLLLVSGAINRRKSGGLSSAKVGDIAMTFKDVADANAEIKSILDLYRRQ